MKWLESDESPRVVYFEDELSIVTKHYELLNKRIDERKFANFKWKTDEFVTFMKEICAHLEMLEPILRLVQNQAKTWSKLKKQSLPADIRSKWEPFATEYNQTLAEWRTFTEKFYSTFRWGPTTKAKPILSLDS